MESNEIRPNLFFCKDCEIIFSEFCDQNFEKNYEDVEDPQYIDQIENKKLYFNHLIKKISNLIYENDNVLEIGSYYGAFGSQIKNKVKSYEGLELSKYASSYAINKFNLNIINENLYNFFSKYTKKYDVIFMFDVIEHLDDPDKVLKLCSSKLNLNGRLILTTMNMNSLFARITGKYYQWIIAQHKFYFTNKSMQIFLERNNLKLNRIINDVRIINIDYFFFKITQKLPFLKFIYKFLDKFEKLKKIKIKFSLFDINIYCSNLQNK